MHLLLCSNIMEHVLDPAAYERLLQNPDTWRKQGYESAASAALDQGVLTLKLLDWWVLPALPSCVMCVLLL